MTLLQERYEPDPWPVLVSSLCLKRTRRIQAEPVVETLLDRYSTPQTFCHADKSEVEDLLRPLGLWRRRVDELERVADHLFEDGPPDSKESVLEWYGVGEYVANCYAIFVLGDQSVNPDDEKLREFLEGCSVRK